MTARQRFVCALGVVTLALGSAARAELDRDDAAERDRDRDKGAKAFVDCGAGDTIAKALTRGDEHKSLVIRIQGICNEQLLINRDDVTLLAAAPGATVSGSDPATDVIRVTAARVTIDGLTVTGGRNGITGLGAAGLVVRNATVQFTGRTGVSLAQSSNGLLDTSVVSNNARDGVAIDASQGAVVNSQVTGNGRMGVGVFSGGSARIGIDNTNNPGGNVISANASNGIHIVFGSNALIAMNQIMGNGTSAAPGNLRNGINLASSTADVIGGNTISGHAGQGIALVRSTAILGDTSFGVTSVNTISANGSAVTPGGVSGFLDSSLSIRDVMISGNTGFGIILSLRSAMQIVSTTTIQNTAPAGPNPGDAIRLVFGSALFAGLPAGTITGNSGWGLNCTDGESSVINTGSLGIVPGGNLLGSISPTCTGF
jgi:parallel beta-helix repeat protein